MKRVVILGGGIVGLSVASALLDKFKDISLVLLEKEEELAFHQTGRNSGVIHSGIYYKPNSLKASICRRGIALLKDFCKANNINYRITGKVIVATNKDEEMSLMEIYNRGIKNGVKCRLASKEEINEIEPHVSAYKGIIVEEAGIVVFKDIAFALAKKIKSQGGEILLNERLVQANKKNKENKLALTTLNRELSADVVINCCGLYADKVAKILGYNPPFMIIPFRGEYYNLKEEYSYFCKGLIYPVPDIKFPFLGVHFTKKMDGSVECGPNAVLAFAREGYSKLTINFVELIESLTYRGFLRLALKYYKVGIAEMVRSYSKQLFLKSLQKLIPDVRKDYLTKGGSGVRAQVVTVDGKIYDDFYIHYNSNVINVLNAPSPAATSSLAIGEYIANKATPFFS